MIEITKENGKVTNILVNGKPVKKSFMNAFLKAQETNYFNLFENDDTYEPSNLWSRVVKLNGLEYTIYMWVMKWYRIYSMEGTVKATGTSLQTYDNMRYFLLELNPDAYYELVD